MVVHLQWDVGDLLAKLQGYKPDLVIQGVNSIDINYGPEMGPKCQIENWQAGAGICSLAELARKKARKPAQDFLCQLN